CQRKTMPSTSPSLRTTISSRKTGAQYPLAGRSAKLVENVERAMQAEPVRRKAGDTEQQLAGEYVYNGSVANKALELIGKEIGMFVDRKEIGEPGEFSRMSDEELEAFLAQPIESVLNGANGRSKH